MSHPTREVRSAEIKDVPAVIERLEADGVVLVPGYLDAAAIAEATGECRELFERTPSWAHHEDYSVGQSVRMERGDVDPADFPVISSAFARPELEAVVGAFFGEGYIFSRTIYGILDVVGSTTHVQQLHYDKMRHLKSFVYLTDVGAANGPFHCLPGSHLVAREQQRENRRRRIVPTDEGVRQLPEGLVGRGVPVLGEAGTLILFDSDILHHAGIVTEGERLAIRSLSFGSYRSDTWYRQDGSVEIAP
ncbi:phytanoyl-CoA dioxygenase family protein [Kitasatospora sp. LaBMicrA B282]|uniref:phytanoyl-CoA dioxygenase family protein n=1 Tax=Kitasatospora sp. LaBMicrA B282 TaxID=3420949 RepID=UPI003D0B2D41